MERAHDDPGPHALRRTTALFLAAELALVVGVFVALSAPAIADGVKKLADRQRPGVPLLGAAARVEGLPR